MFFDRVNSILAGNNRKWLKYRTVPMNSNEDTGKQTTFLNLIAKNEAVDAEKRNYNNS